MEVDEGAVLLAADTTVTVLLGGRPLVLKLVQLKIITGELSCKSGNEDDIDEEPLMVFENFEAHVATGEC